jgi:hypothetical protein
MKKKCIKIFFFYKPGPVFSALSKGPLPAKVFGKPEAAMQSWKKERS